MGGLYSEGRFNGGFLALPVWGAYIWRGLYMEGLIFGILRYSVIGTAQINRVRTAGLTMYEFVTRDTEMYAIRINQCPFYSFSLGRMKLPIICGCP